MRGARWALGLALLGLLLFASALADTRVYLLGCDSFLTMESTALASANNVRMMATALSGGSDTLAALRGNPDGLASEEAFLREVSQTFRGSEEEDTCYLYISTHGLWESGQTAEEFAFLISDGQTEFRLTAAALRDALAEIQGRKILIIDTCHSGAVIGKGAELGLENLFQGSGILVICSSGAAEESWYWSGRSADRRHDVGSGYFSGVLSMGLSVSGGFGADENRDGVITLQEVQRYLLRNHGASTARVYPEDSDEPVLTYDVSLYRHIRTAQVTDIMFESGALSIASPSIGLSFTVLQPVRVAYRKVFQKNGRWDFASAEMEFDGAERDLHPDQPPGMLEPGIKDRAITLFTEDEDYGEGYVLLQMLVITDSSTTVAASTVLCVPPGDGNPKLSVSADKVFIPEEGGECGILVQHSLPCELYITISDAEGRVVRRLASRESTRPEQIGSGASAYYWSGQTRDGSQAEPGVYTVHVEALVGDTRWYAEDVTLTLAAPENKKPRIPPARMLRDFPFRKAAEI